MVDGHRIARHAARIQRKNEVVNGSIAADRCNPGVPSGYAGKGKGRSTGAVAMALFTPGHGQPSGAGVAAYRGVEW
ncbi:MAG TPA: hypothetical protein VIM12_03940 [Noviherbaspirillum sp.]|jgi:cob(I)alamin adenosyltransferase|uniref:hypothetical protein n=1 Tax=Noviherbaspirillum sp. TaxID=1926288 RepID=UPI002F94EA11